MLNATLNFLSAMLAMDVTTASYKPYPRVQNPLNSSAHVATTVPSHLLMGPEYITFLPKVADMSDPSCHVEPYDAPSVGFQEFPPYDEKIATIFRYRQQQSVNLGSWFIHEAWMTPSVFACAAGDGISEIDIANGWGSTENARAILERHWDTFVTASDFRWLSSIGINTVRLPIGYWNLGPDFCKDTPFDNVSDVYQGSWSRVIRAVNMAGMHGLGVLVDFHGAVGSQNGQDHSGISDGQTNLFNNPRNVDKSIGALTFLMKQFVHVNNVVGIEILNEPQYVDELEGFYNRAIDAMRGADPDAAKFPLYLHNGFDMNRFSQYLSGRHDFTVQDHHSYFVYTDNDRQESATEHAQDIGNFVSSSLHQASDQVRRNMVVGEWSCALTPESMAKTPNGGDQARKDFCGGQIDTYANRTSGWHFWAYNKEDCDQDPGWCFKSAVGTVLPSNFFAYQQPSANWVNTTDEHTIESYANGVNYPFSLDDEILPVVRRRTPMAERFEIISQRRRDNFVDSGMDTRGYNDGKLAAQVFASYNMSKLGFVDQYISDSTGNLGPDGDVPGAKEQYSGGFWRGMYEGEDSAGSVHR